MKKYDGSDAAILKRFMIEHFPFTELKNIGFFTPEMRGDYEAQAKRVCTFFGFKTVYEYGAIEVGCHLSYGEKRPENDKDFITHVPNIYLD